MVDIFGDNLLKQPGIYRCPDNIENFKIRIKIGKINENLSKNASEKWIEQKFSWQEKKFSKFYKQFYADENNCLSDLEKQYHKTVTKMENNDDDFIFSYTNQDQIHDYINDVTSSTDSTPNYLQKIVDTIETTKEKVENNEFEFQKKLLDSIGNPVITEEWEKMVILIDLGEYIQNTWVKSEQPLCKISYNKSRKCLKVAPDFTTTEPYVLRQLKNEEEIKYIYFLENCSKEMPEGMFMNEKKLINKLNNLKIFLKTPTLPPFQVPPKNKLVVFLFFEISSGQNFEHCDVYVEYFIDLPTNWSCQNNLTGRSQMCRGGGNNHLVHFGHVFDFALEYDIQDVKKNELPKPPYIYFEVISKDSWERHRTEGLTYQILPIFNSGMFEYPLQCFRFSKDFFGELRRSFIGDYRNFDDISWVGVPNNYEGLVLNKFGLKTITTGQLNVKISVVHQSQAFLEKFGTDPTQNFKERLIFEKLQSSSLIKSVEEVLQAFKKARREMLEAKLSKKAV